MDNKTGETIEELFESLLEKYQGGLEEKMRGTDFSFFFIFFFFFFLDSVDLLHYNFHKISLNRGVSYKDSPKWVKNKKATTNPKINDTNAFNALMSLNVLYVPYNTEKIRHASKSKYNLKHENQLVLSIITDGENVIILQWKSFQHYLEQ